MNISDSSFVYVDRDSYIKNITIDIVPGGHGALPHNCICYLGKKTTVNGDLTLKIGERNDCIIINNDCLFASNIRMTTTDNHAIYDISTKKRLNISGNITVGSHCWFCNNVTILNGINILRNSVIATGCVVTKSFHEENLLIGGIPGQILRKNINWSIRLDDQKEYYTDESELHTKKQSSIEHLRRLYFIIKHESREISTVLDTS